MKHLSTGPELPYDIGYSAMATSPDGNGVILVGGSKYSSGVYSDSDSILELKADGQGWVGAWTTLTTKLQYARQNHIVIPLLMNKDICGLNGIVSKTTGITKALDMNINDITAKGNKTIENSMIQSTPSKIGGSFGGRSGHGG